VDALETRLIRIRSARPMDGPLAADIRNRDEEKALDTVKS
jgi:hypothetical protein